MDDRMGRCIFSSVGGRKRLETGKWFFSGGELIFNGFASGDINFIIVEISIAYFFWARQG